MAESTVEDFQKVETFLIPVCTKLFLGQRVSENISSSMMSQEWELLFNYASCNGLLPLFMSYIHHLKLKDRESVSCVLSWYMSAQQQVQVAGLMETMVEKLAGIFQSHHIDMMVLKGISLAQYYPDSKMRMSSDIDFYLYDKKQEGLAALKAEGVTSDDTWDYHAHACFDGIRLELHQSFIDIDRVRTNQIVENVLQEIANSEGKTCRCNWMQESVQNCYKMTPTMNAIFLMRHMADHLVVETVTLRMLYDWALFLLNEGRKVNWERIKALYEEVGMMNFACRIQHILISHLGMPVGDCCPLNTMNDSKTKKLWNYILTRSENSTDHQSPLKAGIMKRYQMIKDKWKYDMVYPKDSIWITFIYMALRGVKTLKNTRK